MYFSEIDFKMKASKVNYKIFVFKKEAFMQETS